MCSSDLFPLPKNPAQASSTTNAARQKVSPVANLFKDFIPSPDFVIGTAKRSVHDGRSAFDASGKTYGCALRCKPMFSPCSGRLRPRRQPFPPLSPMQLSPRAGLGTSGRWVALNLRRPATSLPEYRQCARCQSTGEWYWAVCPALATPPRLTGCAW